jgi:hypothetical protein
MKLSTPCYFSFKPFGLPEMLVAVHTSRLSCREAEKASIFTPVQESSGESKFNRLGRCDMTPVDSVQQQDRSFDYGTPYDLMVGLWNGMSTLYDANGVYQNSTPSLVSISWLERPRRLRYRQIEELEPFKFPPPPLNDNRNINDFHFDLEINGKSCQSTNIASPYLKEVKGTETRPNTYIFMLKFEQQTGKVGRYYINQYFINPNERHIIGPFIWDDDKNIAAVVAQTFTRIS